LRVLLKVNAAHLLGAVPLHLKLVEVFLNLVVPQNRHTRIFDHDA
jgi:hypothetical protein